MSWIVLIAAGVCEAGWALSLSRSEGFTKLGPTLMFVVLMVISVAGLGYAMRDLPVGTAYAVWTGIGASLTVAVAMVTGQEPVSVVKVLLLAGLVGCVIGLKLVEG